MDIERLERASAILRKARKVAVLTGAGISAESGVPTFRGAGGLWDGFKAEELSSVDGFLRSPQRVWQFHNMLRLMLKDVQPNAGHRALAALEQTVTAGGGQFTLATQNIDALHQAAGSRNVLELHGTLFVMRCFDCGQPARLGFETLPDVPKCASCGRNMRPNVVWFGEALPQDVWATAAEAAQTCDVLLSVGTSAVVYPAAGLIDLATQCGAWTIEVNLEPTPVSGRVDIALHGNAAEILPRIVQ